MTVALARGGAEKSINRLKLGNLVLVDTIFNIYLSVPSFKFA
jgi:hypothetical protein